MTIITSLISLFTKTPSRLNPSTFSSDMDTRLSEENSRITQMNDMSTQMNIVAQEINQKSVAIYNQAITGGYSQAYIDRSQLTPYAELTASGGETLFIVADNSDVIVYKNSIELVLTADYTINVDGITIDFVTPLSASDFIQVFDATKLDSRIDTKLNINSYTSKTNPVDADEILISDSATSYSLKKLTWANIKITVLSSFGVMINTLTAKTTPVSADEFIIGDSASSYATKKVLLYDLITVISSSLSSLYAALISPAFTGIPTAPTATPQTNNTQIATTAYVDGKIVLETAIATTSGAAITLPSIPSWVKKISIMFIDLSTTGTSDYLIQIGSGSIDTTGYISTSTYISSGSGVPVSSTIGFNLHQLQAGGSYTGHLTLEHFGNNIWVSTAFIGSAGALCTNAGNKTLVGVLDSMQLTTVSGTETFDAGSVNIRYEG